MKKSDLLENENKLKNTYGEYVCLFDQKMIEGWLYGAAFSEDAAKRIIEVEGESYGDLAKSLVVTVQSEKVRFMPTTETVCWPNDVGTDLLNRGVELSIIGYRYESKVFVPLTIMRKENYEEFEAYKSLYGKALAIRECGVSLYEILGDEDTRRVDIEKIYQKFKRSMNA